MYVYMMNTMSCRTHLTESYEGNRLLVLLSSRIRSVE